MFTLENFTNLKRRRNKVHQHQQQQQQQQQQHQHRQRQRMFETEILENFNCNHGQQQDCCNNAATALDTEEATTKTTTTSSPLDLYEKSINVFVDLPMNIKQRICNDLCDEEINGETISPASAAFFSINQQFACCNCNSRTTGNSNNNRKGSLQQHRKSQTFCCNHNIDYWLSNSINGGSSSSSSSSSRRRSHSSVSSASRISRSRKSRPHLLLTLLLIIVLCIVNSSTVKAQRSLQGEQQTCNIEGEEVQVSVQNSKCFQCSCKNGFVKCEQEHCPPIDDCYLLEKKPSDCCRKCKDCIFRGKVYSSGSEWTDPRDPCKSYKCVGSVITETIMKCYTQCDANQLLKPKPGECCPTCQGCKINGQIVLEGQEVVASVDDRCLVCQCMGKQLTCAKKTCPVLNCPISKQKIHPNDCCPRCTEHRELVTLTGKCMFNNSVVYDKTQFMPDRCTNCTCINGTSICERKTCPILECSREYQENNGCCPRCITSEARSECIYNGTAYQNNDTWNLGPCRSCRCNSGNIRCSEMRCPMIKCKSNEELKTPAGQCCPQCVETAAVCTVFGDPHFKTFDGKFFSFQGSCKYLLTEDCRDRTFSIRLTNDARGTKRSSWTKTITLKMRGIRVNLGRKMRVKVNGSRIVLPYSDGAISTIESRNETILLRTETGLTIEWDGNNFLQVTAPSTYKRRLCGLCGNYNGNSRDDLTSRDGVNHTEVWRFANSWKVGGHKACSRKKDNMAAEPTCKARKKNALCRPLQKSEVFGHCGDILNSINYHNSCKMDVCECPSGLCHCDSFAAYARECQRLGVSLPNWRLLTQCPLGLRERNITATIALLHSNQYYGDVMALLDNSPMNLNGILKQRPFNKKHQRTRHNQINQNDFITKHVPRKLLTPKSPGTPPPLH